MSVWEGRTDLGGQALGWRQRQFREQCESGDGVDALGGEGGGSSGGKRTAGARAGVVKVGAASWRAAPGRSRSMALGARRWMQGTGSGKEKGKRRGKKGSLTMPVWEKEVGEGEQLLLPLLDVCGVEWRGPWMTSTMTAAVGLAWSGGTAAARGVGGARADGGGDRPVGHLARRAREWAKAVEVLGGDGGKRCRRERETEGARKRERERERERERSFSRRWLVQRTPADEWARDRQGVAGKEVQRRCGGGDAEHPQCAAASGAERRLAEAACERAAAGGAERRWRQAGERAVANGAERQRSATGGRSWARAIAAEPPPPLGPRLRAPRRRP
uniref:Uncharacterized protein n=1 Tax=Oryza sativa subsp. japonica TaxID=39947 RepID=Q6YT68_ORYSJ|nr:hypothetical protein [Oryza sativa Japonica Group]